MLTHILAEELHQSTLRSADALDERLGARGVLRCADVSTNRASPSADGITAHGRASSASARPQHRVRLPLRVQGVDATLSFLDELERSA